jgi:trehalose 6-phosphate synthase
MADAENEGPFKRTGQSMSEAVPITYDLLICAALLPAEAADPGTARWRDRVAGAFEAMTQVGGGRSAWVGRTELPDDQPLRIGDAWLHSVTMSESEIHDYARGYCASTLSPVYHGVDEPIVRREWSEAYRRINARYAAKVDALASPGATVWVHDHHLQLMPELLRRRRPDLRVGIQLHSLFPPVEMFLRLPDRLALLNGLLSADLIGVPDQRSADNLRGAARQLLGIDAVHIGVYPPGADLAGIRELADDPQVRSRAAAIRAEVGGPPTVFLAIGRLDHNQGLLRRIDAYSRLLTDRRVDPTDVVLLLATTSAERTDRHEQLRQDVERRVAQVNGDFGRLGRPVVHNLHRDLDRREVVALYLAADVLMATPLSEGTTVAAKEYLATRADGTGRVVLSEFSGTAAELPEAMLVNPHDLDAMVDALDKSAQEAATASPAILAMRDRLLHAGPWVPNFVEDIRGTTSPVSGVPAAFVIRP